MAAFISEINYKSGLNPPEYVEIAVGPDEDPSKMVISLYGADGLLSTQIVTDPPQTTGEVNVGDLVGVPDPDNPGWTIYTLRGAGPRRTLINGGTTNYSDEANYVALTRIEDDGTKTSLDAYGVLTNAPQTLSGGAADGVTTVLLDPDRTGDSIHIDVNGRVSSGPITRDDAVICFVAGTLIDTEVGPVAVEDLAPGMMVLTRDAGPQPLRWVGRRELGAAALEAAPHLRPIRIGAGALGDSVPSQDLLVSPQHRVLVSSEIAQRMFGTREVLVPAKQLLELDGIAQDLQAASVAYYHFLFDSHQVVTANGAATKSLFTGPEALRAVGSQARAELFEIFPDLADESAEAVPARMLPPNPRARQLAARHRRNDKPLFG